MAESSDQASLDRTDAHAASAGVQFGNLAKQCRALTVREWPMALHWLTGRCFILVVFSARADRQCLALRDHGAFALKANLFSFTRRWASPGLLRRARAHPPGLDAAGPVPLQSRRKVERSWRRRCTRCSILPMVIVPLRRAGCITPRTTGFCADPLWPLGAAPAPLCPQSPGFRRGGAGAVTGSSTKILAASVPSAFGGALRHHLLDRDEQPLRADAPGSRVTVLWPPNIRAVARIMAGFRACPGTRRTSSSPSLAIAFSPRPCCQRECGRCRSRRRQMAASVLRSTRDGGTVMACRGGAAPVST